MAKILAASCHTGGINSITPVIREIINEKEIEIGALFQEPGRVPNHAKDLVQLSFNGDYSISSMDELLAREKPDLILTGRSIPNDNDDLVEQTMTIAARERGVPSLTVFDYWANYAKSFSYKGGRLNALPSKIAIMDNLARDEMIEEGVPGDLLVVTGNPHFDQFPEMGRKFTREDREKVRSDLRIPSDYYVIMFASQPIEKSLQNKLGYTEKTALADFLGTLKKLSGRDGGKLLVLSKIHPAENPEDLEKIAADANPGFPVVIDKDYNTTRATLASDVIISPYSTVLVEALLMKKPVISYQPGLTNRDNDAAVTNRAGITQPIYDAREGEPIFKALLETRQTGEYEKVLLKRAESKAQEVGLATDGKSTQRVKKLVSNMIG